MWGGNRLVRVLIYRYWKQSFHLILRSVCKQTYNGIVLTSWQIFPSLLSAKLRIMPVILEVWGMKTYLQNIHCTIFFCLLKVTMKMRISRQNWILWNFDILRSKNCFSRFRMWEDAFMFWALKATYTWLKFVPLFHIHVLTTTHPYLFILWIPTGLKQPNFCHF